MSNKDTCNVVCINEKTVNRLKAQLPTADDIEDSAGIFSMLGDATRIKIVFSLSKLKELCVCDIANILGLTISAASHQLRKLRDNDVVKFRNDGKMVYYSLADGYMADLMNDVFRHGADRKKELVHDK